MSKELTSQTPATSTPSSHWRVEGAPDPHAGHYDGERAALAMGKLTDDELANGAFMNYDQPLNLAGIIAGTHSSPIAWMTAVKDRIRWLSRSLERVAAGRDALAAELKALRARAIELEAETKSSEEMQTLKFCEREWSTERAAMMNTIHALRNCGDAHPVPARELTDADIALCIASADKSFAQERISGKPVLGVWSKHLARAIERHLKGEGE